MVDAASAWITFGIFLYLFILKFSGVALAQECMVCAIRARNVDSSNPPGLLHVSLNV